MTTNLVEQTTKATADAIQSGRNAVEPMLKTNADAMAKTSHEVTHAVKGNTDAVVKSGNAAFAGFQELAKAYQALASRNAATLTASIQALAGVKTPAAFMELQRKLVTEGMETAMKDFGDIARLTSAVFSSSFEPIQGQVEKLGELAKK